MAVIIFDCPACGQKMKAPEAHAGKTVKCPHRACAARVNVPDVDPDLAEIIPIDEEIETASITNEVTEGPDPPKKKEVLRTIWTWFVVAWGWIMLACFFVLILSQLEYFLSPQYRNFWADVQAHYLKLPSAKKIEEFTALYGEKAAEDYVEEETDTVMIVAILPSEQASITAALIAALNSEDGAIGIAGTLFFILVFAYFPAMYAIKRTQLRNLRRARMNEPCREACKAYFGTNKQNRILAFSIGILPTLFLSWLNAVTTVTPAFEAKGVHTIDLTISFFFLGYFSGIWLRIIATCIDTLFLRRGINPHMTLVDDLIACVIMVPIIWLVFQNNFLAVLTMVVAAFSDAIFLKWKAHRELKTERETKMATNL